MVPWVRSACPYASIETRSNAMSHDDCSDTNQRRGRQDLHDVPEGERLCRTEKPSYSENERERECRAIGELNTLRS